MNFYEELVCSEEDLDTKYKIRTVNNYQYIFIKRDAKIDWSEKDKILIFTDIDGNRIALNWLQIEAIIEIG